jgi:hypothetical protein
MQCYVIQLLRQVGGFLLVFLFPSRIKLTATITEILLKVALNTITHKGYCYFQFISFFIKSNVSDKL